MADYKCSIIADPNGQAWDFSQKVYRHLEEKIKQDYLKKRNEFATKIDGYLRGKGKEGQILQEQKAFACMIYEFIRQEEGDRLELNPIEVTNFSDEEYKPKIKKNVRMSNCFFINDSNLNPDKWYTMLRFVNNALRTSSRHEIINVIPYHKFSRQDRKDESRVPISAKDVADSLRYDHTRVLTIDVHNDAIQGFYDIPFDSLPPYRTLFDYLREKHPKDLENLAIVAPDEGAKKRIKKYAEEKGIEIALLDKYRETSGKLSEDSLGIQGREKIRGKVVLIPDDIISTGGTQIKTAIAAKKEGAIKVIGYGTHALCTEGYDKLSKTLDLILVGDTIKQPYLEKHRDSYEKTTNLEVISFIPLIGEAIYRINKGESLSALYE